MNLSISNTAFTAAKPIHLLPPQEQAGNSCVITYIAKGLGGTPLYEVKSTLKRRTVEMLAAYALKRLAPFGIPDLMAWKIEVCELDYDYYQVELTNSQGAKMGVEGIILTNNKCGVSVDHGVYARLR